MAKSKKNKKKERRINKREEIFENKLELKKILKWFLLSRVLLIVFLLIKGDLSILELYDSEHYLTMAKNGYVTDNLYAFFPLYPLVIKGISFIIPSGQIVGMLISNVCAFLSILVLHELTKDKKNYGNLMCLIFSPILAYSSMVYTESMFMLLTLLGYYLYKKNKYLLAGIVVGLSILTRNSGIILWGAIGLEMLIRYFTPEDNTIKFKNILLFGFVGLGIGMIYPIYLYFETGNFLKFITIQSEMWGRVSGMPWDNFISDIKVISRGGPATFGNILIFLENWISFILVLIMAIKIFKKDKAASIYMIVSLIAFTITYRDINYWKTLASISLFRYVLNLFPIYLYLLDNKRERTRNVICFGFIVLGLYNAGLIYAGWFLG